MNNFDEKFEQIRRHRANIPDIFHGAYRKKYDKAMTGRSIRAAIDSKCLDCMCWQGTEVRRCNIVTCPLHPYRPGVKRSISSNLVRQKVRGAVATKRTGFDG